MALYRFCDGKAVLDDAQEPEAEVIIDLSQYDDDDDETPHKSSKRLSSKLPPSPSSTPPEPLNGSSSKRPASKAGKPESKRAKSDSAESNGRIPAEAKTKVAIAMLLHGRDGIDRVKLSAETGLTSKQISQLLREEGTVWKSMVAAAY